MNLAEAVSESPAVFIVQPRADFIEFIEQAQTKTPDFVALIDNIFASVSSEEAFKGSIGEELYQREERQRQMERQQQMRLKP